MKQNARARDDPNRRGCGARETLEILERWGADAIRDCDGTDYPEALKSVDAKVYSTYYTTRKDNAWAKVNPDEVQQCHHDGLSYSRGRFAFHPADAGHQPGADGREHPRRHQALVGGRGPHRQPRGAPWTEL